MPISKTKIRDSIDNNKHIKNQLGTVPRKPTSIHNRQENSLCVCEEQKVRETTHERLATISKLPQETKIF